MRSRWFAPVCIGVMFLFSVAVYHRLPEQVPMHWNLAGEVDGYGDRWFALLFYPVVCSVLWFLVVTVPKLLPRLSVASQSHPVIYFFLNMTIFFQSIVHVVVLVFALGWQISVSQILIMGSGLLLALLGNECARLPPNWFVGIRTPWTLSNPEVWRRTHRVGGRLLFVTGLAMFVVALVFPLTLGGPFIIALSISTSLFLIWYSYDLSRQLSKSKS